MHDFIDEYKNYRSEDKHECSLLSGRLNTLLIFQSFCATAAAIVSQKSLYGVVLLIAVCAFLVNGLTSLGVGIGCKVLREWHHHGTRLITANRELLKNYFLNSRAQPDALHKISIEWFGIGLSVICGAAWLVVISVSLALIINPAPNWVTYAATGSIAVIILAGIWIFLLVRCWRLAGGLADPDPR